MLDLLGGDLIAKLIGLGAVVVAIAGAFAKAYFSGKAAQRAADAGKAADIIRKQRDEAAKPLSPGDARQRMRDGQL